MRARRLLGWTIALVVSGASMATPLSVVAAQDKKSPPAESSDPYFSPSATIAPASPIKALQEVPAGKQAAKPPPPAAAPQPRSPQSLPGTSRPSKADRLRPMAEPSQLIPPLSLKRPQENFGDTPSEEPDRGGDSMKGLPEGKTAVAESHTPNLDDDKAVAQASGNEDLSPASGKFRLPELEAGTIRPPANLRNELADSEVADSEVADNEVAPDEIFEAGRVLVIVGSRPILVGDLLQEVNQLIETHAANEPEARKKVQRNLLVHRLLPKFIDRQLVYLDAVRALPEGAAMEQINESLGKAFDEEALPKILEESKISRAIEFDAQLRGQGSSLRQFRQSWIDDQFVRYTVSQKMNDEKDEVSYQEMKDYYDQNLDSYKYAAKVRWEQLMIRFDRSPDREAARAMIAQIGNEVVAGAPLSAVAQRNSHDHKASEGGMQGWTTQGSLAAESLEKALFELPLNELSDVIETPLGYHIVRVLERTPAGAMPFRDAQVEIKEKLLKAKQEKRFDDYLKKLRAQTPIEVIDQTVKLPDQYLVR